MKIILRPRAPYSFDLEWKFHFNNKPQPEIYEYGEWRRAFKIREKLVPVSVRSAGSIKRPKLIAHAFCKLSSVEAQKLKKVLEWIFNVQNHNKELYEFMDKYAELKSVKEKLYGLTPPPISITIFEGIVKAILQQQIALNVAFMMTELLIRNFGECVTLQGKEFWAFPQPIQLVRISVSELCKKCKLSKRKSEYILNIAKAATKEYNFEILKEKSNEDVIEELTKFKGIGKWTAELLLAAVMRRPYAIPATDLGVRRVIGRKFFNSRLATEEEVRELAKKWGKFQGEIIFYLLCEEHHDKDKEV